MSDDVPPKKYERYGLFGRLQRLAVPLAEKLIGGKPHVQIRCRRCFEKCWTRKAGAAPGRLNTSGAALARVLYNYTCDDCRGLGRAPEADVHQKTVTRPSKRERGRERKDVS